MVMITSTTDTVTEFLLRLKHCSWCCAYIMALHPPNSLSWRYFYSHFWDDKTETFRSLTGLTRKKLTWDSTQVCLIPVSIKFLLCHTTTPKYLPYLMCTHMPLWLSHAFFLLPEKASISLSSPLPFPFTPPPLTMEKHTHNSTWQPSFPQAELDDPI